MQKKLVTLRSTKRVVAVLGGTKAVAKLAQCKNLSTASNWKGFETFPSNTYVVMIEALEKVGKTAPPWLWGMIPRRRVVD